MKRSAVLAIFLVFAFIAGAALAADTEGPIQLAQGAGGGSPAAEASAAPAKVDAGDTAWLLISSALVMLMTPGLALFYAGMVRRKNVLGTMMHSFVALVVITFNGSFSATVSHLDRI